MDRTRIDHQCTQQPRRRGTTRFPQPPGMREEAVGAEEEVSVPMVKRAEVEEAAAGRSQSCRRR